MKEAQALSLSSNLTQTLRYKQPEMAAIQHSLLDFPNFPLQTARMAAIQPSRLVFCLHQAGTDLQSSLPGRTPECILSLLLQCSGSISGSESGSTESTCFWASLDALHQHAGFQALPVPARLTIKSGLNTLIGGRGPRFFAVVLFKYNSQLQTARMAAI